MTKFFKRMCEREARARRIYPIFREVSIGATNKEIRATPLQAMFHHNQIFLKRGDWNANYVTEILNFPGGKNDDMVDATAIIATMVNRTDIPSLPKDDKVPIVPTAIKQELLHDGRCVPILNARGQMQTGYTMDEAFDEKGRGQLSIARMRI
ncbi:MAG: hypothetical protein VB957_09650 [Pseudomonadales bacterium]